MGRDQNVASHREEKKGKGGGEGERGDFATLNTKKKEEGSNISSIK